MAETNATSEYCCTCQIWQNEIVACGDPVEIARKVKLAFKKMPGEAALVCFAKLITAELPHPIKVAVWDAVRYSHIWWGVDEVLKGDVMNNPIVQQAFADAVPMRQFRVANRLPGWEITQMTVDFWIGIQCDLSPYSSLQLLTISKADLNWFISYMLGCPVSEIEGSPMTKIEKAVAPKITGKICFLPGRGYCKENRE